MDFVDKEIVVSVAREYVVVVGVIGLVRQRQLRNVIAMNDNSGRSQSLRHQSLLRKSAPATYHNHCTPCTVLSHRLRVTST